ncbi:hypothetical protein BBK36DRAFT_1168865 [Trichoderma citrinoviride]|uniref:Uncharacterized protein n=1 Tax=Trichoderma citrinoviride TaxID=58853 RepID=A0A2T4BA95_9HYPO|nr:hypothetical protein BBK36DRAFT_1168865 [Trichoderma citrinoviride]PTB66245.1 hypothetical protein BBK36DRAFT_1168865 [Trichoderma citrinoviride]
MDVIDRSALSSPAVKRRHAQSKRAVLRRRSTNYLVRSTAKRLIESKNQVIYQQFSYQHQPSYPCISGAWQARRKDGGSSEEPRPLRAHIERDLFAVIAAPWEPRKRGTRAPRLSPRNEEEEGRELARSAIALPSDTSRLVRRPSFEREDAFRVASTAKGKVQTRASPESEDAQIAELYHQGLLYDGDEQRPEEAFNLNSIQHEEPVYTIRPAKRGRKAKKAKPALVLSYTDLGDCSASAKNSAGRSSADDSAAGEAFPPLRVVYGQNSSNPSFDVETSQLPDLMHDDSLSDYDCFTDHELDDDVPSQTEIVENANNSSETWIMLG